MKKAVSLILALYLLISTAGASGMCPRYGEYYSLFTIVTKVKSNGDVYCRDSEGNIWSFYIDPYDEENWERGDLCTLLMKNTDEDITKHIIESVHWEGYVKNVNKFMKMIGWIH